MQKRSAASDHPGNLASPGRCSSIERGLAPRFPWGPSRPREGEWPWWAPRASDHDVQTLARDRRHVALANAVDVATHSSRRWSRGRSSRSSTSTAASCSTPPLVSDAFPTGYAVTPGEASIVHHVLALVVDPQATGQGGLADAAIMQSSTTPHPTARSRRPTSSSPTSSAAEGLL